MPVASPARQKVTITLEEDLYDLYAGRADKSNRPIERELALHLKATKDYTSTTPIYLNDEQRQRISQLLGHLIQTPEDLILRLHRVGTVKVQGVEIMLDEPLLTRLQSRVFGGTLPDLLRREVTRALEEFTGLR